MKKPQESPVIQEVRQRVQEWINKGDNYTPLNLSRMNITELPVDIFVGCSQLKIIWLCENQLTKLPADLFAGCPKLQHVDLQNNQLTELPTGLFSGCSDVQFIYLQNNQLTELPADLFAGCSRLEGVYLQNNELTELPVDLFVGCSNLRHVWLLHNKFIELPADLFADCSKLKYIEFDKSIIYGILWSLHDFGDVQYNYCVSLKIVYPFECALVERYRRVVHDPLSYAWSVRKYAIMSMNG